MNLQRRAAEAPLDEDLIEEIVRDASPAVALAAVTRADCPAELLVDLSFMSDPGVRAAIMAHPNTSPATRARLAAR